MANAGPGGLQGRVLVVDDLDDAAASLGMLCELHGAEVRVALDGQEALRVCEAFRPDIVLMDITMPNMDGYEAARRIRAEEWGVAPLLIALTGWGRDRDIEAARDAGFDGHLLKPVDPESLVQVITDLQAKRAK